LWFLWPPRDISTGGRLNKCISQARRIGWSLGVASPRAEMRRESATRMPRGDKERANMEIADRLTHLLPHWIEHNEAHAEQLAEWVVKARSAGMEEIADSISAAANAMRQANARLTQARDRLAA